MSDANEPIEVALLIGAALDACAVDYFLTGSVASGILGQPRMTRDIDFVVHLRVTQVDPFADALGVNFDVDRVALLDAVKTKRSWNIFHLPTMARVDLFVLQDVIDVIRTQSVRLDDAYLNRWSRSLGLEALLAKARAASV